MIKSQNIEIFHDIITFYKIIAIHAAFFLEPNGHNKMEQMSQRLEVIYEKGQITNVHWAWLN